VVLQAGSVAAADHDIDAFAQQRLGAGAAEPRLEAQTMAERPANSEIHFGVDS